MGVWDWDWDWDEDEGREEPDCGLTGPPVDWMMVDKDI